MVFISFSPFQCYLLIHVYQEAGYLYIGRSSHLQEQIIPVVIRTKDSAKVADGLLEDWVMRGLIVEYKKEARQTFR